MRIVHTHLIIVFAIGLTALAPVARSQVIVGPSSPAVETDREAAELVRACVQRIGQITKRTCNRITRISFKGVARMRAQAQEGAPDEVLADTARATIHLMREAARDGVNAVNATARRCVQRLDELDASPIYARAVLRARERGVDRIQQCLHERARRVRFALNALTGDRSHSG